MRLACSHCRRPFEIAPYRLERNVSGLFFCSKKCRRADGRTLGRPRVEPNLTCPVCGTAFYRKPAELRAVNWCSYQCAGKGSGNLRPTPKGVRRAPQTEFQPGQQPHNSLPVGSETTRRHRDESERVWVKVAEPNVWRPRAIVVWETANGAIPRGYVVHHRNRVTTDDRLDNLEALSRATHFLEHRPEFEERRATRVRASHRASK